jgi:hypothetical protein
MNPHERAPLKLLKTFREYSEFAVEVGQ